MLRVSLKLTNMYIQINKNALSLEEEKQISHEAQQVEELWRTLSYYQRLSEFILILEFYLEMECMEFGKQLWNNLSSSLFNYFAKSNPP